MKKSILMPVFNQINYDGRVQRTAESLSEYYNVIVFAIESEESFRGNKYTLKTVALPNKKFGSRLLSHISFLIKLLHEGIIRKPNMVYAHDYYMVFPGWFVSFISGAVFVYDAHELIIDNKEKGGRRGKLFYFLEKIFIKRAKLIICANEKRAMLMKDHYSLDETPVVIRNIAPSIKDSKKISRKHVFKILRSRLNDVQIANIIDKFTLVYQGDINLKRGLYYFLDVMTTLNPDDYHLLLIGEGPDLDFIEKEVSRRKIKNVTLLGRLNREEMMATLSLCNIGIVTYTSNSLNNKYCAPNKIYEYSQVGLPIIGIGSSYLCDLIEKNGIGKSIITEKINNEIVFDNIRYLKKNIDRYTQNCMSFAKNNTWDKEKNKLCNSINGLLNY